MVSQEAVREMQTLFMDTIERLTQRVNNLEKGGRGGGGGASAGTSASTSASSSSSHGGGDMYSQAYQTLLNNKKAPPLPLPPVSSRDTGHAGGGVGIGGTEKGAVRVEPGRIRPSSNGSNNSGGGGAGSRGGSTGSSSSMVYSSSTKNV